MPGWTQVVSMAGMAILVGCVAGCAKPPITSFDTCAPTDAFAGPPRYVPGERKTYDGQWLGWDLNTCYGFSSGQSRVQGRQLYENAQHALELFRHLDETMPVTLGQFLDLECPGTDLDHLEECINVVARFRDEQTDDEFVSVQVTNWSRAARPGDLFFKWNGNASSPLVAIQQSAWGYEACPSTHPMMVPACDDNVERVVAWLWAGTDPSGWQLQDWVHDEASYYDDSGGPWDLEDTASQ